MTFRRSSELRHRRGSIDSHLPVAGAAFILVFVLQVCRPELAWGTRILERRFNGQHMRVLGRRLLHLVEHAYPGRPGS